MPEAGTLLARLTAFRRTRAMTLALTAGLSQAELDRRPAAERWSVGEVLDHLRLAEGYFAGEVEALIDLAEAGEEPRIARTPGEIDGTVAFVPRCALPFLQLPAALFGAVAPEALRGTLARTRLLPLRNPTALTPRRGRPAEELRGELAALPDVARLEGRIAAGPDLPWSAMRYSHPLLGPQNVEQILRFADHHERRHQEQIREILEPGPGAGAGSS